MFKLRKSIALISSAAILSASFTGFNILSASAAENAAEKIYNMSELTEVPSKSGPTILGDLGYSAAEKGSLADVEGINLTTPGAQVISVSKSIRTKKIKTTVTLQPGETVVEYYRGCNSGGSGKDVSMVVTDTSGATVAAEENTEDKSSEVFAIAYKSENGGTYSIVDNSTGNSRTELYAVVVTPYTYRGEGDTNPPDAVTGLTATAGNNSAYIKWDPVPGADSYDITVNGEPEAAAITDTEYTVVGLTNGTDYAITVTAKNANGSTDASVHVIPAKPTVPPTAFTLTGTAKDKAVSIYWTAAQYAEAYDVYRNGEIVAKDVPSLSYDDSNLANGTAYTYKVQAKNEFGAADSNEITVTPAEPPKTEIKITKQTGWLETAYVEWTNPAPANKYEVFIKPVGGEYTKLDDELVRYYGSYYRADAVGLKAGQYQMKIQSGEEFVESDILDVKPYIREGFAFSKTAHYDGISGIGAYKMDGTLKDGAQVLYIDDTNKDTVTFTVKVDGKDTVGVGLVNILALREKNKAETTPLAIRMIGQVKAPSGKNSSGYVQLKATENLTFEGIGEDATTYDWSFLIRDCTSTEVRNLAVMEFYDDGISLDTNDYNCWIHNLDIFYGEDRGGDQKKGDGSLDVKKGSDYCTFSYNHFWDSGKCSLCGMKDDSYKGYHMTYFGNWFDHSDSRMPRVRGDQVHVYNNYFDGNSKYGVGACTGSSVFVENNVFRNVKYPVLTSQQGSDIAGENTGTFSGEDGGVIKLWNNQIIEGSQSHPVVTYQEDPTAFDAYAASARDEQVPSTVTARKGGGTYSNFDTAADMYAYTPLDTSAVAATVQKYAGRIENGDFTHIFNNDTDDASADRDPVLGGKLQKYKTSLVTAYTSPMSYPATNGELPTTRPTSQPIVTPDPNATPTPSPAPPTQAEPHNWNLGEAPFTITDGDTVHPDTQYFPLSSTADRYNINNSSITAENFAGLTFKGVSEAGYQKSGKTFGDGYKGTWQLKTGGAGSSSDKYFSFYPAADGSVTVYARSGSSTKDAVLTIAQGTETATLTLAATGNEPDSLPALTMNVTAGIQVKIYSNNNTGYYGINYTSESYVAPTTDPNATSEPTSTATTSPTQSADECVKITATYNGDILTKVTFENVPKSEATDMLFDGTTKVMYWDSIKNMTPVTAGETPSTQAPENPTKQPAEPGTDTPTVTVGDGYSWNANDMTAGDYKADYAYEGLTIGADASEDENGKSTGNVVIESTSQFTYEGVAYTNRIKTGGTGDPSTGVRTLSFVPDVDCDMVLIATSSSSSADRTIIVEQSGTAAATLTVGVKDGYKVSGLAANSKVTIYSTSGGLNVYGIKLTPASGKAPITAPTHTWTASADDIGKTAGSELMAGLTLNTDNSSTNKNYVTGATDAKWDGGVLSGTALVYTAPKNGTITVSFDGLGNVDQQKTVYIATSANNIVAEYTTAGLGKENPDLSAKLTAGTTYYIYGGGTKARFSKVVFQESE